LLVSAGKLVSVAQDDSPLAVFTAVSLGAAKRPRLRAITDMTGHVLQVNGVGEVITNERHDVFRDPISSFDAFGCPVEPGAHLLPAAFVTAKRPHDHYIVGA